MPQVRIYGTAREGHREKWKGKYRVVRRHTAGKRKGQIITWRKWTPKKPIIKSDQYSSKWKDGVILKAKTGEELRQKVAELYDSWEWEDFEVESP